MLVSASVSGTLLSGKTEAAVGINKTINFQGKISNTTGGTNIADGTYNMQFKIYHSGDGVVGGGDETLVWTESRLRQASQGVTITNGIFQVNLGSITSLPGSVDFNSDTIWLSINVGSTNASCTPFTGCTPDGEMSPMVRFTSAAYAFNSDRLGGIAATGFVQLTPGSQQTGSINVSSDINSATNLQTGGTTRITSTGLIQNATWNGNAVGSQYGGTGINTSASTGVATVSSGTWSITSSLAATLGGTGQTTYAIGDLLYANTTSALSRLAAVASGQCLKSQGINTAPIWGTCAAGGSSVSLQGTTPGAADTGNLNITGTGILGTALQTPSITSSAALSVTAGSTLSLVSTTGSSATFDSGTTGAVNIGTNANAKTITIGTTTGGVAQIFNLGYNSTAGSTSTVNVGNLLSTSTTTIQAGTGNINLTVNQANAGTIVKTATTNSTSAFQIQNSNGASGVLLSADTVNQKLQIFGAFEQKINTNSNIKVIADVLDNTNFNSPESVYVSGKYAYMLSNGNNAISAIDISDPTNPIRVSTLSDATNLATASQIIGINGKYAIVTAYGSNRLTIVDISNPNSMSVTGSVTNGTTLSSAAGVVVVGRYAYVATNAGYLTVVDIANPASPVIVGSLSHANLLTGLGLAVQGKYAYVAANNRVTIIDISNPLSPSYVGASAAVASSTENIVVRGHYAYLTSPFSSLLAIVDVTNPASPTLAGQVVDTTNLASAYGVRIAGNYAYVAANQHFSVVDISNPSSPSIVKTVDETATSKLNSSQDFWISGRYAYLAAMGGNRFTVIDLGGGDIATLAVGNAQVDFANIVQDGEVGNNLSVRNGLNVGAGGAQIQGDLSAIGNSTFNLAAGKQLKVNATAVPTSDMVTIDNTGQAVTTAGVSGLQINYVGGAAAVEGSAARVDLTPGSTTGGTWNGLRIVANTTGATTGVTENGIKIEGPTTPGAGTETGVYIGTGWDTGLQLDSGVINIAGFVDGSSNPSDPVAPASGYLSVYTKKISGRMMLKAMGPSGVDYAMQPGFFTQAISYQSPLTGTTVSSLGQTWTVDTIASTPAASETFGVSTNFATAATANDTAGVAENLVGHYRGSVANSANGFFYVARIGLPDASYGAGATGARIWSGLTSGTAASMATADNPAGSYAGFQYSTNRGDTTWKFITKDGTTQSTPATATGITFAQNKVYDFFVYTPPQGTTIYWRVTNLTDGQSVEGSTTTNLPVASTAMRAGTSFATLTTTARNIRVLKHYVEADR